MQIGYAEGAILFAAALLANGFFLKGMAGWDLIRIRYPDRPASPALKGFWGLSGTLGRATINSPALRLEACEDGLRLKGSPPFLLGCQPIFIPWDSLKVTREKGLGFFGMTVLHFGSGDEFRLTISDEDADALWRAAGRHWPEFGSPPPPAGFFKVVRQFFPSLGLFLLVYALLRTGGVAPQGGANALLFMLFAVFFAVPAALKLWRQR